MSKSQTFLKEIIETNEQKQLSWQNLLSCLTTIPEEIPNFTSLYIKELQMQGSCQKLTLLDVIDYLMDHANDDFRKACSSKRFIVPFSEILKVTNDDFIVDYILSLLKKWGTNKDYKTKFVNFEKIYNNLLKNKIEFPENFQLRYNVIFERERIMEREMEKKMKGDFNNNKSNVFCAVESKINEGIEINEFEQQGNVSINKDINNNAYSQILQNYLISNNENTQININNKREIIQSSLIEDIKNSNINIANKLDYADTVKKVIQSNIPSNSYTHDINKLFDYVDNISLSNQMMDVNDKLNNDIIKQVINELSKAYNVLMEKISSDKITNEKLFFYTITITEDINQTISRWNVYSTGKSPEPFVSSFPIIHHKKEMPKQESNKKANTASLNPYQSLLNQVDAQDDISNNIISNQPVNNVQGNQSDFSNGLKNQSFAECGNFSQFQESNLGDHVLDVYFNK